MVRVGCVELRLSNSYVGLCGRGWWSGLVVVAGESLIPGILLMMSYCDVAPRGAGV